MPYVEWVAIFAIANVLGRKVYGQNTRGTTFPNLYVMMVGPPGTGKTEAESLIRGFLIDSGVPQCAQHVSKASLIDELKNGKRQLNINNNLFEYHQLCLLSSEFVETFPAYDIHLLGTLAHWWDCPREVKENKRHLKEQIYIKDIVCSIMTGIQPGLLTHSFPAEAWSGGFLARTIMVYVPQKIELLLRARGKDSMTTFGRKIPKEIYGDLSQRLGVISKMYGCMDEDETFVDEYLKWREAGRLPRPKHPRLTYYNDRREHQLEKLSIIAAASRGSMVLTGADYRTARAWLESAEGNLDDIFVEMSSGDDMQLMQDMHSYISKVAKGPNVMIREAVVHRYLTGRVATQRIDSFLETAMRAGFIKRELDPKGFHAIAACVLEEFSSGF